MNPLVLDEVGAPPEGLPTVAALIGLLDHVRPLVLLKAGVLAERLPAFLTYAGLPCAVCAPPPNEVRVHTEGPHTVTALAGLLAHTSPPLTVGDCVLVEGLSASLTHEGFLSTVEGLMLSEVRVSSEGFPALATYEGAFSFVKPLMAT